TSGAICLSSSSHFPLRPYSKERKPVILPPGRAKLGLMAMICVPMPTLVIGTSCFIGSKLSFCNCGVSTIIEEAATSNVYPSGVAAATCPVPSAPPAPGRFFNDEALTEFGRQILRREPCHHVGVAARAILKANPRRQSAQITGQ